MYVDVYATPKPDGLYKYECVINWLTHLALPSKSGWAVLIPLNEEAEKTESGREFEREGEREGREERRDCTLAIHCRMSYVSMT